MISLNVFPCITTGGWLRPFAFTAYTRNWYSRPGSKSYSRNSGTDSLIRRNGAVVAWSFIVDISLVFRLLSKSLRLKSGLTGFPPTTSSKKYCGKPPSLPIEHTTSNMVSFRSSHCFGWSGNSTERKYARTHTQREERINGRMNEWMNGWVGENNQFVYEILRCVCLHTLCVFSCVILAIPRNNRNNSCMNVCSHCIYVMSSVFYCSAVYNFNTENAQTHIIHFNCNRTMAQQPCGQRWFHSATSIHYIHTCIQTYICSNC